MYLFIIATQIIMSVCVWGGVCAHLCIQIYSSLSSGKKFKYVP